MTLRIIPIFIPLGQIGNSPPSSFENTGWVLNEVREYLNSGISENRELRIAARFISQRLESLLEGERCVLIFDGMDELPREGYDEKCQLFLRFAQQWTEKKGNRIFFSCREFDYPKELCIDSLVLFPFDWEDVEKYLKSHLPAPEFIRRRDEAKKIWEQGGANRALLDNPFFLHLATRHMLDYPGEPLPMNRGLLFDSYVKRIFRNESQIDIGNENVACLLEDLALWITTEKTSGTKAAWTTLEATEEGRLLTRAIRANQDNRSLPYFVDITSDGITFRHHRLREFFTARSMKRRFFMKSDIS